MRLHLVSIASFFLTVSSVRVLSAEPARSQTKPAPPASDPARSKAKAKGAQLTHREGLTVTGTHLKRDPQRGFLIASPIYVLDNDTIRNSGAVDVHDLLTRRGVRR